MGFHSNNGKCDGCQTIFNKYPRFISDLESWFKYIQASNPDAHISDAGRGRVMQEEYFSMVPQRSKAHYGQSPHNYNAAIDIFQNKSDQVIPNHFNTYYDRNWFLQVVNKNLTPELRWLGDEDEWQKHLNKESNFFELPHVEIKSWRLLRDQKIIKLVE